MSFVPFYDYFPEEAKREMRSITVLPESDLNLPADDYGFLEMFPEKIDRPKASQRRQPKKR